MSSAAASAWPRTYRLVSRSAAPTTATASSCEQSPSVRARVLNRAPRFRGCLRHDDRDFNQPLSISMSLPRTRAMIACFSKSSMFPPVGPTFLARSCGRKREAKQTDADVCSSALLDSNLNAQQRRSRQRRAPRSASILQAGPTRPRRESREGQDRRPRRHQRRATRSSTR